jgi:truncated hemoglobin YjbI
VSGVHLECRRLAETLYDGIERDAVLGHFFPGKTRTCAIEEFSAFLVQFLPVRIASPL